MDNPSQGHPFRVAYVVHALEPGGLERCVAHFANHLDRSRFQPVVVCLSHRGAAAEWITERDVPILELHKREGNDPRVVGRLSRVLRDEAVDLVHSHNWGTLLESTVACRLSGTRPRHIHAEHGQELDALQLRGAKRRLRDWARRWAFRRTDAVVACAESVRQRLTRLVGDRPFPIDCLPNGVDVPQPTDASNSRSALRQSLGLADTTLVIGSVGRLAAIKNFSSAVETLERLVAGGHDVQMLLVGDGPDRDRLEQQAQRTGIAERLRCLGHRQNVGDWLRVFDVYVNSSLGEAMSMSVLEAMAVGLPVVVTDVGDSAALIGGDPACGVVVPPANSRALADAVADLLVNPDQRRKLGTAAQERHAEQYSVLRMVQRYQDLYSRVCAETPARRLVGGSA